MVKPRSLMADPQTPAGRPPGSGIWSHTNCFPLCELFCRFAEAVTGGGYPARWMVYFRENRIYKWMITSGARILGNLHILIMLVKGGIYTRDTGGERLTLLHVFLL